MKNKRRGVAKVTRFHQQPTRAGKLVSEFSSRLKNEYRTWISWSMDRNAIT
jgi:hypothetical protein